MKNKAVKITLIVVFVLILVVPMICWPILAKYDNTELDENREPAPFPDFDSNFFINFDNFFMDRVPIRNSVIKAMSEADFEINKLYETILSSMGVEYYITQNGVIYGQNDWLFFTGDDSIGYYRGTNLPTEEQLAIYLMRAQKVKNYFESQGKQFVIFVAPNKEQIYYDCMPRGIKVANEVKRIDTIQNYFTSNSDIKFVYPKQELLQNKTQDERLYYRWDTHWNQLGAYIGVCELLKSIGEQPAEVQFTRQISKGKKDLQNMVAIGDGEHFEYLCNYMPEITSNFIEAQGALQKFNSSNPNNKKLFLSGDSFRIAMRMYLSKHFTETTIADRNFVRSQDFDLTELESADIIVLECVERYDPQLFGDQGILQYFINKFGL